jgi:hypothetical protein
VRWGDLARDFWWPHFSKDIVTTRGVHWVLAPPLPIGERPLGAVTGYAKGYEAFDDEDVETAQIVAIHATAVLADWIERRQLSAGLTTRTTIGQATGIIMHKFDLDATTAFSVLRRLSQNGNEKIRDIAVRIVETRTLD